MKSEMRASVSAYDVEYIRRLCVSLSLFVLCSYVQTHYSIAYYSIAPKHFHEKRRQRNALLTTHQTVCCSHKKYV